MSVLYMRSEQYAAAAALVTTRRPRSRSPVGHDLLVSQKYSVNQSRIVALYVIE